MASLESLPADQRAVLTLVLQRGRTFDEIAEMLSIDRAAVRDRALRGLDAIGPETELDAPRRALITDYLLGQLPSRVAETARAGLASSPAQRAWARVLAAELSPLARDPLPEIPTATAAAGTEPQPAEAQADHSRPEPAAVPAVAAGAEPDNPGHNPGGGVPPPSSRVGGAILIGIGVVAVIAVVVILIATSGSSKSSSSATQASVSTTAQTSSAASTTSGQSAARPVAQINLGSPNGNAKLKGVGIVVRQGTTMGLVIRAQNVPANSGRNAYAVWLFNSNSDEHILGFVNPGVTNTGVLQTAGPLPANASHYSQLIVTLESSAKPTVHGPIVLQGTLKITG